MGELNKNKKKRKVNINKTSNAKPRKIDKISPNQHHQNKSLKIWNDPNNNKKM